jgi:3-dehydroquinate synthase
MRAASALAVRTGDLKAEDHSAIERVIAKYGPIPAVNGIQAERLAARLGADKKTIQGNVHFVLPTRIGEVRVRSGIDNRVVVESIQAVLA